ncbi:hypothetical protein MOV08_00605 [Streptomyces yunnanensis]|uniref:Uncharacterized protein n=1 Tax=Streptomyces yunnanensis TaxID=156453 RepID=A0ABY8A2B8_9ACTN|nr:hypothetical protein [Streptomyces yunnanensis]WEB37961.1 hypothetical protein MOV08_00605 [Streptomyces yunnanensis]
MLQGIADGTMGARNRFPGTRATHWLLAVSIPVLVALHLLGGALWVIDGMQLPGILLSIASGVGLMKVVWVLATPLVRPLACPLMLVPLLAVPLLAYNSVGAVVLQERGVTHSGGVTAVTPWRGKVTEYLCTVREDGPDEIADTVFCEHDDRPGERARVVRDPRALVRPQLAESVADDQFQAVLAAAGSIFLLVVAVSATALGAAVRPKLVRAWQKSGGEPTDEPRSGPAGAVR